MRQRVNTDLKSNLQKFGLSEQNACFHCGTCTAVCSLTEKGLIFPRKQIRALQMGLETTIASGVEPWMCYYCGDCNEKCPRDAKPGELMMTLRRYLTSVYDWTGLSKLMYTSKMWEFVFIFLFAVLVLILSLIFTGIPAEKEWLTPEGGVAINNFAPVEIIHTGDLIMAGILAFFLISNIINMYIKVIIRPKIKVPFISYFTEIGALIWNTISQWKFKKCDKDSKPYWAIHFLLMSGYCILFTMIVVFLSWFQTENIYEWYHPQRLLGYYATFGLLLGITYFMIRRYKKNKESSKHSHYTDWTFLVLLLLTTVSGILVHIFRINGMALPTYYMYIFHLMILVPMLMIEVPFSKWSHLAYRPFAIYFSNLKKAAKKNEQLNF